MRFSAHQFARLLNLNGNPLIGNAGARHVAEHLVRGGRYAPLKALFLSGCGLSCTGARHLADSLPSSNIEIMELRDNNIGANTLRCYQNCGLCFLIGDNGVIALGESIQNCKSIHSLFLSGNSRVTEKSISELVNVIRLREAPLKVWLLDMKFESGLVEHFRDILGPGKLKFMKF